MATKRKLKASLKRSKQRLVHGYELKKRKATKKSTCKHKR